MWKSFRLLLVPCLVPCCALALVAGCSSDKKPSSDSNASMSSMPGVVLGQKNIIETATGPGMEQVTTLVTAIKAAGLVEPLEGPGPFTVFAPTNAAFAALPPGTVDDLLKPENKEKLKMILLYHVHKGDAYQAADIKTMDLSTMEGQPLKISVMGDTIMVNDAKVIKANIECSNGVIHWIDKVLMPS